MARRRNRLLLGAGLSVGATLGPQAVAHADTFQVTNLLDDGSPGTLRSAISDADSNPGFDRVLFDSGLSGTITLQSGELDIFDNPVEIVGPGSGRVTVNANRASRVFDIYTNYSYPDSNQFNVTISGLTLTGGDSSRGSGIWLDGPNLSVIDSAITGNTASGPGGGIYAEGGSLDLESSVVSGNTGGAGPIKIGPDGYGGGGGIAVTHGKYVGTTTIHNSTISGNHSAGEGGGVSIGPLPYGGNVVITGSTISGNSSDQAGGGIFAFGMPTVLANSTVSGNTAPDGGGVLTGGGYITAGVPEDSAVGYVTFTARNCTIAGNTATGTGGGVYSLGGGLKAAPSGNSEALLLNTIVATNTAASTGPNVAGPVDAGFALIDNPAGAAINETTPGSNVIGKDPGLGPLADNGGPTDTRALSVTSPALDAGDGTGATHDQRGALRPFELQGVPNSTAPGADGSDIGAYELQGVSNKFRFGKVRRNKHKGIAWLPVIVPGPGTIGYRGAGLVHAGSAGAEASRKVTAGGKVKLKIKTGRFGPLAPKIRHLLEEKGSATVRVLVTYRPLGGTPGKRARKLRLIQRK